MDEKTALEWARHQWSKEFTEEQRQRALATMKAVLREPGTEAHPFFEEYSADPEFVEAVAEELAIRLLASRLLDVRARLKERTRSG